MENKLEGTSKMHIDGKGYAMWSDVNPFLKNVLKHVRWKEATHWKYLMSIRPDEIEKGYGRVLLQEFIDKIGDDVGVVTLVAPYTGMPPRKIKSFLASYGFVDAKREGWMVRYPVKSGKH